MSVRNALVKIFRGNRPPVYVDEGYIQTRHDNDCHSLKLVLRQDMVDLLNRMINLAHPSVEHTNLDHVDITKTPRLWLAYSDNVLMGRLETEKLYLMLMESILRCTEYGVVTNDETALALRNSIKCFCHYVLWYGNPESADQKQDWSELCGHMKERISARIWDVWPSV